MKKYIIFIFSFVLLYIVYQFVTGWVLTALYTPDIFSTNKNLSQDVSFGQTTSMPLLVTLLIATLAYLMSQKLFKSSKK
ncbi:hypothetical protein [Heyndrickxia vini]|uniref:Uncharacterized protein n=1 Tax=Heyndrickxia vini TaxID=1476025 RepID=A0ABX7E3Y6_9BACI|nr:hypothetical protein [Heyndrickxia vini]QQZ09956.1 hypothetical protein I5776_02995 [Heyndrickxia vini]